MMQNFARKKSGFTLLEILLVIVLLSLLATSVIPRVASISRVGVQSSVRRFTGLVRYAYDNAVLTGRIHRVVLNLDEQTWKVEAAQPGYLVPSKIKEEAALKEAEKVENGDGEKKPPASPFKAVGKNLIDKLPNGVQLVQFESWRLGKGVAATKGEVVIYAYPSGFVDEATVVLAQIGKEKAQNFRVTTKSLTGRVNIQIVNDGKIEE